MREEQNIMFATWISRLFAGKSQSSRRQRRAARPATRPTFRPRLEILEDRTLPTVSGPSVVVAPVSIAVSGTAMGNNSSAIADNGNMPSTSPESISSNGQYAVFTSSATNLTGDTIYSAQNVYLRNLSTGQTSLVGSAGTAGTSGDVATQPVVTADGRYVAFVSNDSNLPNNSNGGTELFVRDMVSGQTYMVSQASDGSPANASIQSPTIAETANGQLVIAYQSNATNLTANQSSSNYQIYVATLSLDSNGNIQANTLSTQLASADNTGTGNGGNGDSSDALLSKDGSTLVFQSLASNLPTETADAGGQTQIFAFNVATGALTQVNPAAVNGGTDNASSFSVSDNGQYIAYLNGYQTPTTSGSQIFGWNAKTGQNTAIAQEGAGGSFTDLEQPTISGDGSTVAFVGSTSAAFLMPNVYVSRNWQNGGGYTQITNVPNEGTGADLPVLSDNGQILAFVMSNDPNSLPSLYVDNLNGGSPTEVANFDYNAQLSNNPPMAVSSDGSTVIFNSYATNLVPGVSVPTDTNGNPAENVYAYSLPSTAPSPTNVSGDVKVTEGGFRYDFTKKAFVQTMTITNTSGSALNGPLYLVLPNLSSNATLANASGSYNGDPYLTATTSTLAPNQSITLTLEFTDPTHKAVTYDTPELWQNI
jgi:hypothetical protein